MFFLYVFLLLESPCSLRKNPRKGGWSKGGVCGGGWEVVGVGDGAVRVGGMPGLECKYI